MYKKSGLAFLFYGLSISCSFAAIPLANIAPLSIVFNGVETHIFLGLGDQVRVAYIITNRDSAPHRINFKNTNAAVRQVLNVPDSCDFNRELPANGFCQLGLLISGNQLTRGDTIYGPEICLGTTQLVCSRPNVNNILTITRI